MNRNKNIKRRSFLRNTALGTLALGLATKGSSKNKSTKDSLLCDVTTKDFYRAGPFYTDNPPLLESGQLAMKDEEGTRIIISGRIFNLDCSEYIPDTIVDVWHGDNAVEYDNDGFNPCGYTKSNSQGFYLFETIKPGKYLNGNSFRPSHIHYKITPPGFESLTTQLYFEGDDSIPGDAAASITSGNFDATNRIIALTENTDGILEGTFDIIINGEGITVGVQDLHIDKGMVYNCSPNPFDNEVEIHYGVFKRSKVGLAVYNMLGQEVAVLEDEIKSPEKYYATWRPDSSLESGHYFVALRINDLQVHYLKLMKK